jgi:MFS family permease
MVGDFLYEIAFAWLILTTTESPVTLAAVMVSLAVPRGVLMLVGGAMTDRLSARTVMLWSHVLRGMLVALLAILVSTGHLATWHFFAVGISFGIADAFFWPASSSILPTLIPVDELARANALVSTSEQAARFVGPVCGGVLIATAGITTALFVNAATFGIAAFAIRAAPRVAAEGGEAPTVRGVLTDIRAGLSYARRKADVRAILLLVSASTLTYSGLFAVGLPALAKSFEDGGTVALGFMVGAWGLGQLIGSLSAGVTGLPDRWGVLIVGMTLTEGCAFALLGFIPSFWAVSIVLLLLGIGVAYSTDVALPTWIQVRTPSDMLGRVSSILDLPRVCLEPLSIAAIGLLIAHDVRAAFIVVSVPMLAVAALLLLNGSARRLRNAPDAKVDAHASAPA